MSQRYPLEPLARALKIELGEIGGDQPGQVPRGLTAIGQHLGVTDPRYLRRLRRRGLPMHLADRGAIRCGKHPSVLWPNWNTIDDDELGAFDEGRPGYFADDPAIEELDREHAPAVAA